jgi:hypothetical protein
MQKRKKMQETTTKRQHTKKSIYEKVSRRATAAGQAG